MDVLEHFIQVETHRKLDKLILFMTENQAVAFILNVLRQVFGLIHIELEFIQRETAVTL